MRAPANEMLQIAIRPHRMVASSGQQPLRGLVDLDDAEHPAIIGKNGDVDFGECCERQPFVPVLLLAERFDLDLELPVERVAQLLVVRELAADQMRLIGPQDPRLAIPHLDPHDFGQAGEQARELPSPALALLGLPGSREDGLQPRHAHFAPDQGRRIFPLPVEGGPGEKRGEDEAHDESERADAPEAQQREAREDPLHLPVLA